MDGHGSTPAETAEAIFARIETAGSVTMNDVLALRRGIYGAGNINTVHADWIFRVDHACRDKDDTWQAFYVDALTDYFIWQTQPPAYITEDQGEFLMRNLLRDNRIAGLAELELLVNLTHWAVSTPELFKVLVLEAVCESVLEPDEALYGAGRAPGLVTPADVAILRRALYGGGGLGGYTVSRSEAEVVFRIEEATDGGDNAPEWQDLFVKAIANFLMFPKAPPSVLNVAEFKQRENWLNDQRGTAALFKEIGKSALSFDKLKEGWEHMDTFGFGARREEAERERQEMREALSRESIGADEARWLAARINANGKVTTNERMLLEFIRQNSPHIDSHLDGFMKEHGI